MRVTSRLTGLMMLALTMASMWFVGNADSDADRVFYQPASISAGR